MADLVTGARGQAHITPKNDAVIHRGMMGVESCILDFGEKLAPALIPSQPTNIRILDGCGMFQGRFFEIEEGSYDTIAIPNGAQGYNRIDIVCAKITQNENGTQTFSWEVVQGTQTSGTPTPPTVEEHSLDDGDEFALMPIASVELEGVNIVAVETVAIIGKTIDDVIKGVADYIAEQGTSGIWQFRKWASGYVELETQIQTSTMEYMTSNQTAYKTVSYPFAFTSLPNVVTNFVSKRYASLYGGVITQVMDATTSGSSICMQANVRHADNYVSVKVTGYIS